ncbi:MAG: hypothetical protein ACJ761_03935 [Chloroflexota bacterium]
MDDGSDQTPGERRLDRPPSDRYRVAEEPETERAGSPARAVAFGLFAAIGGAIALALLGGVVTISAGLIVVAAVIGWVVAIAVLAGDTGSRSTSWGIAIAIGLALGSVALGQLGLWLYARTEGGVLPIIDYLAQTFGFLVPIELVLAGLTAWVTAR